MIKKKIFIDIKKLLDQSLNPLFLFDDDCDGTCAYLILRKYKGSGYSVPVKGKPEVSMDYEKRIQEFKPDLIFVLDKPKISQDFIDKINVPIVWIDHHPVQNMQGIKIYCNPLLYNPSDNRSTTYWSYQIIKKFEWIALVGCVADYHIPDFASDFSKKYPDLFPPTVKDPGEALYETQIGKLVKIFNFNLKGTTTEVRKSINSLIKINDPYEILNGTSKESKFILSRFAKTDKIYEDLLNKSSKEYNDENFLIYTYPNNGFALSSELATELQYRFKEKFVIVGRVKDDEVVLSLRSNKYPVRDILLKSLEGISGGAYGGGHLKACGAGIPKDQFSKFLNRFRDLALQLIKS